MYIVLCKQPERNARWFPYGTLLFKMETTAIEAAKVGKRTYPAHTFCVRFIGEETDFNEITA